MKKYLQLMRLDKPVGIILLLWPVLWSLWIAGQGHPPVKITLIFILGVIIMRSAGCVINDIADRKFDKLVTRTKNRPIATHHITVKQGLILLSSLILLAFLLVIQLNYFTVTLAFLALFLACLYPYTKRFLAYPQLFLGLAYSMGIPMAFTAILNHIPVIAIVLFIVNFIWTVMYDTEYAMTDKPDDIKAGIKSTAILLGNYDIAGVMALQGLVLFFLYSLHLQYYYLILIFILFLYQFYLIHKRRPEQCFRAFLNNQWVGLVIFIGIIISTHS